MVKMVLHDAVKKEVKIIIATRRLLVQSRVRKTFNRPRKLFTMLK